MKTFRLAIGAAALSLALAGGAANAAVIYDNGSPDLVNGNEATAWVQAEDFTLGAGGAVGGAGVYIAGSGGIGNWDGTVEYFLFADNAGTPGAVLTSGSGQNATTTDTGIAWVAGGNTFFVEFDLESVFAAAAGTTYWLGIHLADDFARDNIYWVTTASNGTSFGRESQYEALDNWSNNFSEHAFFLTGDERVSVPEPSILALLGAGLFGLGLIRVRRTA
ncbi:PEP-CTERM sorting domain-containing protein [Rhodospirillaceae bacterium SYSU D60014]|uniref:PEP-CTERM sorting domain-containing protein n=1 Tax=Virgifigura deserti TaxID=2268457 RepID=UPI000E66282E